MNLTEAEFEATSPQYFNIRLLGLRRLQAAKERQEWERARWLAVFIAQPHSKKPLRVTDIARFPWEEKELSIVEFVNKHKSIYDKLKPNWEPQKLHTE